MKVSVNWLKQFVDFDLPPTEELAAKIGAQLGAVEEIIDLDAKYQGIIIANVVSCDKHPDADKLSLCMVDDGGKAKDVERGKDGLVQVVCGAPNVHAGMLAAWLPPGATVPSTVGKEPFVLEAREIRGKKSNGMLASPKELGIGDSHEGLLVLDKGQPGDDLAKAYKLDDQVIDIENKMFTHRPDCFGALGVAREVAGILHKPFKSPDWYVAEPQLPTAEGAELPLKVKNELPDLVPRFTAVAVRDVDIKPSPAWLQVALSKVGQSPINNVVDLTNFYMLVTGQPLHAYDYDKVKALSGGDPALVIRKARKGEKIKLLNGKEIEPRAQAIMIATDKQLIGVGGVMGGSETEVDENTKNIILECANFDMYSIRRTSMENGLFTDAVTRFTKGQSPLQCPAVSAKTVADILKLAGGAVASGFIDEHGELPKPGAVKTTPEFINSRLGLELDAQEIEKLLSNVEVDVSGGAQQFKAPFWRTDIEIPEDIVEEVGRLYGYDHLPRELPGRDLTPADRNPLLELKADIRARLSKAGANEVLTYSFVPGSLLDKTGQDPEHAFEIANALSPDLQYYRMSLMPSLLEKVHPNLKSGHDEFALFEVGRTHGMDNGQDDEGLPREFEFTGLVIAVADKLKRTGAPYYQARKYLEELVGVPLEFKPVGDDAQKFAVVRPYDPARSAMVSVKGGPYLGIIGEFRAGVSRSLKLPKYCAGFEIDTTALLKVDRGTDYTPLPRFPKVTQDITLKVPSGLTYQELSDFLRDELDKAQPKNSSANLAPLDIYAAEGSDHKNLTFRLSIASYERTLTDSEVNKLLDKVAAAAKAKFQAERV